MKALSNVTSFPYTIRVLTTYSSIAFLRNEIRKYRGGGIRYVEGVEIVEVDKIINVEEL